MEVEGAPAATWADVARRRQRDILVILPLTVVAAAGSTAWLPAGFTVSWFLANFVLQMINMALCWRILRIGSPTRWQEAGMATYTFIETGIYSVLPASLLSLGDLSATVAAMTMFAAIALSSAAELPASRLISLSAMTASLAGAATGILLSPHDGAWLHLGMAGIGVLGMYGYVLEGALHRLGVERRLAAAVHEARRREAEAAAANSAKSIFLATMSHEIRTPLNGVLGMTQVMARDPLSPVQRERLEVIRQSGEALTALLNNVLDLSKIEAGQMQVEAIAFDLADILESARSAFAPLAAEKGLALHLDLDPRADARFEGDPTRLRQVVYNLVSNAVKFTEAGEVRVQAAALDHGLTIAVRDTGPGLDAEAQSRLFRRFTQLDASTTRRHGGSGLGLAIARQLCRLMGGDLRVESALGLGSTFILDLPLKRLGPPLGRRAVAEPAEARPQEDAPLSRLRVLAAEDNPVNQQVLRALLAPLGVEPVVVPDGAQALEAWASEAWDLVLMDVRMPVMDGVAATREIRAREAAEGRARTPIIGLTADAMAHQVEALLAAGMDAHVAKPIDAARLYGALGAVA